MQKKDNSGATKEIPQSGVLQFPREFKYRLAILRRTASGTLESAANDNWSAPLIMKLDFSEAGTGGRLVTIHSGSRIRSKAGIGF